MKGLASVLGALLCATLVSSRAALADPTGLRALTIRSGFEKAQVQERDEDEPHWGRVHARSFTVEGAQGLVTQIVELQLGPKSPRSLAGFLRRFRASHGCTAKEIKDLPAIKLGASEPEQLSFEGTCEGGDVFVNRVVLVGEVAYELHVYVLIGTQTLGAPPGPRLREAMRDLSSRLEPVAPARPAAPSR